MPEPLILETPRLLLRPMVATDADALLAVFTDPAVMASFGGIAFTEQDMAHWVGRNLAHQERHGYGLFSVIHKADDILIGDCGLEHQDEDLTQAELGYDLLSAYWNQGIATEAAVAVRDHAFGPLGLNRLYSMIRVGNEASRRVAIKVGMHLEGVIEHGDIAYWRYGQPKVPVS